MVESSDLLLYGGIAIIALIGVYLIVSSSLVINVSQPTSNPQPNQNVTPSGISINSSSTSLVTGGSTVVTGTVTSASGTPIQGMTVTLYDSGPTNSVYSTTTDSSGNYSFNVTFNNPGTYTIYTSV